MVWVQNQLEYASVGRDISLHCNTESYPPSIHYWTHANGSAISTGPRFRIQEKTDSQQTRVSLTIIGVEKSDFGTYFCVAKNSLGTQDGEIKLSGRFYKTII